MAKARKASPSAHAQKKAADEAEIIERIVALPPYKVRLASDRTPKELQDIIQRAADEARNSGNKILAWYEAYIHRPGIPPYYRDEGRAYLQEVRLAIARGDVDQAMRWVCCLAEL